MLHGLMPELRRNSSKNLKKTLPSNERRPLLNAAFFKAALIRKPT